MSTVQPPTMLITPKYDVRKQGSSPHMSTHPIGDVLTSRIAVQDRRDQLVLLDLDDFPVVSVQAMEFPLSVPIVLALVPPQTLLV